MEQVYSWIFDRGRGPIGKFAASCTIGALVAVFAASDSEFARERLGWFALLGAVIGGYAGGGLICVDWLKARRVARGLPPTSPWRKQLFVGLAILVAAPIIGAASALVAIALGLD